jgi:Tol biopolymer transport system component
VLGTARYMSPEQVRGDDVDTRTDVWAFGCLLYEMLTGSSAFNGKSVAEILAAVLRDDPDWQQLPADTPLPIRRLLRRCLRRDARARLQHIGDARLELLDAEAETDPDAPHAPAPRGVVTRTQLWTIAGVVLAALAAVVLLVPWSIDVAPQRPARLSLELPPSIAPSTDFAPPFAIAPSGGSIVIEGLEGGVPQLYVRALGDLAIRKVAGSDGARQPMFSPDGAWIGFFADRKLVKAPLAGGPVLTIAEVGGNPRGGVWAPDGFVIVAPSQTSGLVRIPDRGGNPVTLTTLDRTGGEYSHRWPDVLPGGRWVIFTVGIEDASFDEARIEAVDVTTGERRVVLQGAGFARYLPPRQLLFVRGSRLHRIAFDPERLTLGGPPEVVLDAVRYDGRNGGTHVAVSTSGHVVYTPGTPSSTEYYLAWIDREGRTTRAVNTARPFRDPRISPDGRRIAVTVGTSTASDLWLVDANGTFSRLSFDLSPHHPEWTPDGARITVGAAKDGRWRLLSLRADGGGQPTVLFEGPNRVYPNAWSADGRRLVFQESTPDTGWDLKMIEVDGEGRALGSPTPLATTPAHETGATVSPDGRWIAYESDELDAIVEVYVRSFPDGAHKRRVSTEGARMPAWGADGQFFYWSTGGQSRLKIGRTRFEGEQLVVTDIQPVWGATGPPPDVLSRVVVTVAGARYDVLKSGARVLMLESSTPPDAASPFTRPVIAFDWADRPVIRRRLLF